MDGDENYLERAARRSIELIEELSTPLDEPDTWDATVARRLRVVGHLGYVAGLLHGLGDDLPEVQCPECDATIRARMADRGGEHLLAEPEQLRYPGGKDGMWVVRCTCGYRTTPSASEQRALQYAREHQRAASRGSGSA